MAKLSAQKRIEGWQELMQNYELSQGAKDLSKFDLKAAFDAFDDAIDNNAPTINGWLPQPFRGAATPADKAFLMQLVLIKRYLEGA